MKSPVPSPLTGLSRWPCNQRVTPAPPSRPSASSPLPGRSCCMLKCRPSSKKTRPLTSLAVGSARRPKPLTTFATGPSFGNPTLPPPPCWTRCWAPRSARSHHPSHLAGVLFGVATLPSHSPAQTSLAPATDLCKMPLPRTLRPFWRPPRRLPALRHLAGQGRPSGARCCSCVQRSWGSGCSQRACQGVECRPSTPRRPTH